MLWSAEYVNDGCLVSWRGLLPETASLTFHAGLSPTSLTLQASADFSPGSAVIDCLASEAPSPNASGRMDTLDADDNLIEQGLVLPLIPGVSRRDTMLLKKLAQDHARKSLLLGAEVSLYRPNSTGSPCPICTDRVSGARLKNNCRTCNGSGVTTGWVGPFNMHAQFLQHRVQEAAPSGAGTLHEAYMEVIRLDAFPRPRTNDRIHVNGTERVYIVGDKQRTIAGVAGVPAVIECAVKAPAPGTEEAEIPEAWFA